MGTGKDSEYDHSSRYFSDQTPKFHSIISYIGGRASPKAEVPDVSFDEIQRAISPNDEIGNISAGHNKAFRKDNTNDDYMFLPPG